MGYKLTRLLPLLGVLAWACQTPETMGRAQGRVRIAGFWDCRGTLIAPDVVLTRAGCGAAAAALRVEFVPDGVPYDARRAPLVRDSWRHGQEDIALLFLEMPLYDAVPAPLAGQRVGAARPWVDDSLRLACEDGTRALCPPSLTSGNQQQAIVLGDGAGDQYAETAALWVGGELRCSAVLVAADLVLTAAHCVLGDDGENLIDTLRMEVVSSPKASAVGRRHRGVVRHAVAHPAVNINSCALAAPVPAPQRLACADIERRCGTANDWDTCVDQLPPELMVAAGVFGLRAAHDVALLFLDRPLENIVPIPILHRSRAGVLKLGQPLVLVGYGQQEVQRATATGPTGVRTYARNAIVDIGNAELQMGNAPPQGCFGDSGGPAYIETAAGRVLVALASRLTYARTCDAGLTLTRLDTEAAWLSDAIEAGCLLQWRAQCRGARATMVGQRLRFFPDTGMVAR